MKEITVTLQRTYQVLVAIDETIVTESALEGIERFYDSEIFDDPYDPNDVLQCKSKYERGLYNFAEAAARAHTGEEVEYINLDKHYVFTETLNYDVDTEFTKMEDVDYEI